MANVAGKGKRRSRYTHKAPAKLDDVRNEINVTPLVDVCLVLLIIFMVVTPMLARGKDVPLPKTRNHATETDKSQPVVAIDQGGQLFFDQERMQDIDALKRRIQEVWDSDQNVPRRVFVKADGRLPYKEVYPLIMAVHDLGVDGVDLGTHELREAQ